MQHLRPERGGLFVDCTVGLGGHARALLERGATRVIGLDRDRARARAGAATLAPWADRVELFHADYRDLDEVLDRAVSREVDGALADLGVSSMQLEAPGRGFSFQRDEPLDMRMDTLERRHGRRSARALDGARARRRDLPVRRGALFAAHRPGHRRTRASEQPIETTGRLAAHRQARRSAAGLRAHRSGDAHVSGAANLGQPGARRPRPVSRDGRAPAARRGAAGGRSRFILSKTAS